jgi:hypothetical protein
MMGGPQQKTLRIGKNNISLIDQTKKEGAVFCAFLFVYLQTFTESANPYFAK